MALNDFFAMIYELGGELNFGNFSESLYEKGFYIQIGMYTIGLCLITVLLYYYGIGMAYPRFNRGVHWVVAMLITGMIAYAMMHVQVNAIVIAEAISDFNGSYVFLLSLVNVAFSSVVFFIFSFVRKIIRITQYTNTPF